jgi:hypothetical protein
MILKARSGVIAIMVALSMMAPAIASAAKPAQPSISIPVSQAVTTTTGVGTLTGQLTINQFKVINGVLNAVGTLAARVTDSTGALIGTAITPVAIPVTGSGTCDILHLTLGPLDLNLLGLMVHLNQIVLDITAQAGPGNLLGNLLCSVADLLNGGSLGSLANLLNQLLGVLGSL